MRRLVLAVWLAAATAGAEEGFPFLSLPAAPRQAALGGAGAGGTGDLAGLHANPAALALLWRQEAAFTQTRWAEDVSYHYAGYGLPTLSRGAYAAGVLSLDFGGFDGYDALGNRAAAPEAKALSFHATHTRSWSGLSAGVTIKRAEESLAGEREGLWAADAGVLYRPPARAWFPDGRLGLAVLNAASTGDARPPRRIAAGASVRPWFENALALADASWTAAGASVRLGVEYRAREVVAVRAGYETGRDAGRGFGLGFGVQAAGFQVDYAFQGLGGLGDAHFVSVSRRFGSLAEAHYEKGMSHLRRGDHARAIIAFGRAVAVDPSHKRALFRLRDANEKIQAEYKSLRAP